MPPKKKPKVRRQPVLELPSKVEARYVKSNLCRVVHVDGAWGGITSVGLIHMALYSDHRKLPDNARYALNMEERTIAEEVIPDTGGTWTREFEVEAIFSVDVAKALRKWLDERIDLAENTELGIQFKAEGKDS